MAYAQARREFEYLETVADLDDWVSLMDDLTEFMQRPNKAYAEGMYERAIELWFGEAEREGRELPRRAKAIKERRCL